MTKQSLHLRKQNKTQQKQATTSTSLQLRPENYLPPKNPRYLPPNPAQLASLLRWSGLTPKETSDMLAMKEVEPDSVLRWTSPYRQKGLNSQINNVKAVPPTVFQFWLVCLGLLPAPKIQRVEPMTFIEKTYGQHTTSPITLKGEIDYDTGNIKVFNLTPDPLSMGAPILEFPANFKANQEEATLQIDGKYRAENCPWEIEDNNEESDLFVQTVNQFLKEEIWKAAWAIHDFRSLKPAMFLRPESLLPIYDRKFEVPTAEELTFFMRWLGAERSDLADIVYEHPRFIRYHTSAKSTADILEIAEKYKPLPEDDEATVKEKKTTAWKLIASKKISPHGWYILTSAAGLSPSIKVYGRKEPKRDRVRNFVTKSVAGVPICYYKLNLAVSWQDATKNTLCISYWIDTEKWRGVEKTACFAITANKFNNGYILAGSMFEDGAPNDWVKAFDLSEVKDESLIADIAKYISFVAWKHAWQFIWYHKQ